MARRQKENGGPEFVQYFGLVLDALRDLSGSGRPSEVIEWIADHLQVTQAEREVLLKSGSARFDNQIQWARYYLVRAGFLDSSKRGVWTLTDKGRQTHLTHDDALAHFRNVQKQFSRVPSGSRNGAADHEATPDDTPEAESGGHRAALLKLLKEMPPFGFERLCQRLLREHGFQEVAVTQKSVDGGIDGHGILQLNAFVSIRVQFQCKRYKDVVGVSVIRDFRGAMMGRAEKGIVITTGTFSVEARKEASRDGATPIELIDGEKLVDLFEELELGLRPRKAYDLEPSFFEEFQDEE